MKQNFSWNGEKSFHLRLHCIVLKEQKDVINRHLQLHNSALTNNGHIIFILESIIIQIKFENVLDAFKY